MNIIVKQQNYKIVLKTYRDDLPIQYRTVFLSCERCLLSFVSVDGVFSPAYGVVFSPLHGVFVLPCTVFFLPRTVFFLLRKVFWNTYGDPGTGEQGFDPGAGIENNMFQIRETFINSGETLFKHRTRLHLYENLQK